MAAAARVARTPTAWMDKGYVHGEELTAESGILAPFRARK